MVTTRTVPTAQERIYGLLPFRIDNNKINLKAMKKPEDFSSGDQLDERLSSLKKRVSYLITINLI
jgi:hypothetical protein